MIAVITAIGLALRLAVMRTQGAFWFDELFSVHFASMPLAEGLGHLIRDVHPPVYYVLLHAWIALVGDGESSVRLLSVLLGAALIPAVAALAMRTYGKTAAWIAAGITAVSPTLLFHSAEARMYPLLLLLTTLAVIEFQRLLDASERRFGRWALLAAAMLATHLTAVTPFAVMAIFGWKTFSAGSDRRRFLAHVAAAALPFLAWFAVAGSARVGVVGREWQISNATASAPLLSRFTDFFAYDIGAWQRALAFAVLALLVGASVLAWRRLAPALAWQVSFEGDRKRWLIFALAILPFLVFLPIYAGAIKYFLAAYPAAVVLVAGGASKLIRSPRTAVIALACYVLLVSGSVATMATQRRFRSADAMGFIQERERAGDALYLSWFPFELLTERYYHGKLPVLSANPYPQMSRDDRLILRTGQALTTEQVAGIVADMDRDLAGADRVFLVTGSTMLNANPVESWFFERGWRLVETYRANDYTPKILLLARP
jgi:mannosyltransferase